MSVLTARLFGVGLKLVILAIAMAALALCALELLLGTPALARWKAEYADASPETRSWYESRELTPAAQKRFFFKSCCAHSDVVKAKFAVSKLNGTDQWFYQLAGETAWRQVPDDVIHWREHAPSGEAVLFAYHDQPTCFFPPAEGG